MNSKLNSAMCTEKFERGMLSEPVRSQTPHKNNIHIILESRLTLGLDALVESYVKARENEIVAVISKDTIGTLHLKFGHRPMKQRGLTTIVNTLDCAVWDL